MAEEEIRTVEIGPPSVARETVAVLKAAFHIAFWSAFLIFGRTPNADPNAAVESPFDVRFQDLDAGDQRLFRAVQEGTLEAEAKRNQSGKWATATELAQDGIPPFAPDPIDKSGYTWRSLAQAGIVNYIGTPAESGKHELLVIITEPPPDTPKDPTTPVDETHHRLGDGTLIHVTVFVGPGVGELKDPVAFVSAEAGWRRVTTAVPGR